MRRLGKSETGSLNLLAGSKGRDRLELISQPKRNPTLPQ
jgi:hypothetical protein